MTTRSDQNEHSASRRKFLGLIGRCSLIVIGGLSSTLLRADPAAAHYTNGCGLTKPHNPYCAYNCWRYASQGYNSLAWLSTDNHNSCFECTKATSCYGSNQSNTLCSQWDHVAW
jgi:hypothetical protein